MSIFLKITVLIMMIVGLVGTLIGNLTFMEFITVIYGGVFLFLLDNYLGRVMDKL